MKTLAFIFTLIAATAIAAPIQQNSTTTNKLPQGTIYDSSGVASMDANNRILFAPDGSTKILQWDATGVFFGLTGTNFFGKTAITNDPIPIRAFGSLIGTNTHLSHILNSFVVMTNLQVSQTNEFLNNKSLGTLTNVGTGYYSLSAEITIQDNSNFASENDVTWTAGIFTNGVLAGTSFPQWPGDLIKKISDELVDLTEPALTNTGTFTLVVTPVVYALPANCAIDVRVKGTTAFAQGITATTNWTILSANLTAEQK